MRELHDVLIGASFADGANEALIARLRSASRVRSFTASEIGLAVHMGDADLRAAIRAVGMRTRNSSHIGRKLAPLVLYGQLELESWSGTGRYRVVDEIDGVERPTRDATERGSGG